MIKRALISVWDKNELNIISKFLHSKGVEIISTGGTMSELQKYGIDVIPIENITNVGSIMDWRVKTLHPKIFGGILADKKNKDHILDLEKIDSSTIDLIIVNFYPF